ncbi:MAG: PTS system mannose/fructose/N-acetylgalactosamine-transporter subunit IIB [Longimicrobiales bacterium]
MNIAHARIDDRLIHGQVVTAWLQAIGRCDEILICDDKARKDQFLQSVLKMTAPPGMGLRVLSVDETIADFQAKANDLRRVLLLTRGPAAMLRLIESGVPMTTLNLGGMGAGPGRTTLHQNISVSEEELNTLRQIQAKGVTIELKMVPTDRGVDFASLGGARGR